MISNIGYNFFKKIDSQKSREKKQMLKAILHFLLFTMIVMIAPSSHGQNLLWSFNVGGGGSDIGYSIFNDNKGFVYVAGFFQGNNVDFDPSPSTTKFLKSNGSEQDAYVAKYTTTGVLVWAVNYGGTGKDDANGVSVDNQGNVYVTGYFRGQNVDFDPSATGTAILNSNGDGGGDPGYGGDIYVAKFTSTGQYVWAFNVGSSSIGDNGTVIVNDTQGNVYVGGYFSGPADFDPSAATSNLTNSNGTVFLAKYNTNGQYQWAFNIGAGTNNAHPFGLKIDASANLFITGYFIGSGADFDPSPTNTKILNSSGQHDIYLAKYNSNGQYQWAFNIGSTDIDVARELDVDKFGNVYVVGDFQSTVDFNPSPIAVANLTSIGSSDIFIAKYDNNGNYLWAERFGSTAFDIAWGITYTAGNVYLTGSFQNTVNFNPGPTLDNLISNGDRDIYLTKFDLNGNYVCAFKVGGSNDDEANRISSDTLGNVYVTGILSSANADFNPGTGVNNLTTNGGADMFVAKYIWPDNPKPLGTLTGSNICPGQQATLTFTATAGIGSFTIEYTNGTTTYTQTNVQSGVPFNLSPTPVATTNYTLISIRDATVCPSTNTVNGITAMVTISSGGATDFTYAQNTCDPKQIQFFATTIGATSYTWNFGNGLVVNGNANPTVTYANYGNYTIKLLTGNGGGCVDSVQKILPVFVTQSNIIFNKDTSICPGKSIQLAADSGISFCWRPNTTISNVSIANTTVKPVTDTTYYFTSQSLGTNLVINGDFSAGNIGFTSDYTSAANNTIEGEYWVGSNPKAWNGGLDNCHDHTTGTTNMLMVNGKPTANAKVWNQTVAVLPNTNYAFSVWVQSLYPVNPADLRFSINNRVIGNNIIAGSTTCVWKQFYVTWNSGMATAANISIVNNNTVVQGNDFAIDDIHFSTVTMRWDSLKVIIAPNPSIKGFGDTTICKGIPIQLNATGGNVYSWTPLASMTDSTIANPIATPAISTNYVVTGYLQLGCVGKDTVKIIVVPNPIVNITPANSLCEGIPFQLNASGGTTYHWSPSTGLSSDTIANPIANDSLSIKYFVTVKNVQGCSAIDSVQINRVPKPTIITRPDTSFCNGASVLLNTSIINQTSFSWSPSTGLSNPNLISPTASPNDSTQYIITANNGSCIAKDTIMINVRPKPVITLNNDTSFCKGISKQLTATGGINYQWTPATGLSSNGIYNPLAIPDTTTKYFVTVTDINGCNNTDSVTITIHQQPYVQTIPNNSVCKGSSVILTTNASSGVSFSWYPKKGLNDSTLQNPSASITTPTQYIVTVSTADKCVAKDTVTLMPLDLPIITKSNDATICGGGQLILSASGGISYAWSPSAGLSDTAISNPIVKIYADVIYHVVVTGSNGCKQEDSVKILIRTGRAFFIEPPNASTCGKESLLLTASGGDIYHWIAGENILSPNTASTNVVANATDIYQVQVNDTVCKIIDTLSTAVVVNSLPQISLQKSNDIDCFYPNVKLKASGGVKYVWSPVVGVNNPSISYPIVTPVNTTTYHVTVTDVNGCSNTDSVQVKVNYFNNQNSYQLPNAFTPNNDGKNDCFGVVSWGVIDQLQFAIYNRWGQRVFYTTNSSDCWDGTYKNVAQSTAAFVYIVSGKTKCGGIISRKGIVVLIR